MIQVALYIYVDGISKRIELYNDEKINITSSVQDIADVSKAKTDFTQAFTIPASKTNNEIFKHWYESAIDGGFDQRIKYDGYIEIDTETFRVGGFSLNSVSYKNNALDNYNITFYGKAKSIKDLLKEDKLNALDFSSLNHSYTSTEVINRITATGVSDVIYPLFAHDRLYNYGGGGTSDVTINAGAIKWNSLFPAISLATILSKITDKYGIVFTGAFLNYPEFSKLWMLFKNTESIITKLQPFKVNFTSKDAGLSDNEVNLTTDVIGFEQTDTFGSSRRLQIEITTTATSAYDILIYKNGVLFNSFTDIIGNSGVKTFFNTSYNTQTINDKYEIYIQAESGFTFTSELKYLKRFFGVSSGTQYLANGTSQTTGGNININNYAPDIKLIDLFSGLVKMFNMVIIPQDETTYELIPLELFYNNGIDNDISANVISDNIDIKKTSMYKNIDFKFEKSENILNNAFDNLFLPARNYGYGDLKYEQIDSLESSTFTVGLPFENPLYERKSDSNFQTITFKDKNLSDYVPKPLLMYDNGNQSLSTDIKIDLNMGSFSSISSYRRFSNDYDNAGIFTLNWGEEVSSWFLDVAPSGLYQRHYSNYLGNIFDIKGRLLIVKCYFNQTELLNIKLNDRIIIRDKRFTINKFSTDLTSGETTLELLSDYRGGIVPIPTKFYTPAILQVSNAASDFETILLMGDSVRLESGLYDSFINYTTGIFTENTMLTISVDVNATGIERVGYINFTAYDVNENTTNIQIPILQDA